tara:strand:+ start:63226 stop:63870 length:645 start_codon:yes stop_codon:yes gene_type:complete
MHLSFRFIFISCTIYLIFGSCAIAQDERYYRKIFTGELYEKKEEILNYKVSVETDAYLIDLNRDGKKERIKALKKDGLDFIEIRDRFGQNLMTEKLKAVGGESKLYKIQLKTISSETDVLILHYYEGQIDSTIFEGRARVYFLTIQNRDFKRMYFYEGPHIFLEKEMVNNKYALRYYTVDTLDYNNDERNEISINYGHIQHIFFYIRNGIWRRL